MRLMLWKQTSTNNYAFHSYVKSSHGNENYACPHQKTTK
jgi:hypothetical protein